MHQIRNGGLSLFVKKIPFEDYGSDSGEGNTYPYTSGEVRSNDFYGAGCYSTCMRPSGRSGVSSSFYIHSGNYDVPPGFEDRNPLHSKYICEHRWKLFAAVPPTSNIKLVCSALLRPSSFLQMRYVMFYPLSALDPCRFRPSGEVNGLVCERNANNAVILGRRRVHWCRYDQGAD